MPHAVGERFSCPCRAAQFTVQGRPLTRFIGHCLICQSVYKAPFADINDIQRERLVGVHAGEGHIQAPSPGAGIKFKSRHLPRVQRVNSRSQVQSSGTSCVAMPGPSIERTSYSRLRLTSLAPHVER